MIITEVNKKGNYVDVTFSNEEVITVHYEIFLEFHLYKNEKIELSKLKQILDAEEIRRIKKLTFYYLGRRSHSLKELKDKLMKKEYKKILIEEALTQLSKFGYVDDSKFAKQYYEEKTFRKKKGVNKIKAELIKKGVSNRIIDEICRENNENDIHYENARFYAEKKIKFLRKKDLSEYQLKQKIYSHLMYKGFTMDVINKVFSKIKLS